MPLPKQDIATLSAIGTQYASAVSGEKSLAA